jgi:hypothetical protein
MKRWLQFIFERFNLLSHVPMIAVFSLSHAFFMKHLGKIGHWSVLWLWSELFVFYFVFFFLLRCYDEIKDYTYDLVHNPKRPLPRGLIKVQEVKVVIFVSWIFLSLMLLRFGALPWGAAALAYSFLMYKEFFVGDRIRPHLTFYAMTHTFVIGFIVFLVSWAFVRPVTQQVWMTLLIYGIINWSLFNVFEFSRKTFSSHEEKPTVDSYSSIFGNAGAVLLSGSQLAVASLALAYLQPSGLLHWALVFLSLIIGFYYVFEDSLRSARIFRNVHAMILALYYVVMSLEFKS